MRFSRGLLCALVAPAAIGAIGVAACGGKQRAHVNGPAGDGTTQSAGAFADGGAPRRVCAHGSADPFPCVEECDRGIAFACVLLAGRFERAERGFPRDRTRAATLYERACELKDVPSCVNAARMHAAGDGVPRNRARQIELLSTACLLGDSLACNVPAKAYATGNGVARDERRAKELWQHACGAGVESACEAIGEGSGGGEP